MVMSENTTRRIRFAMSEELGRRIYPDAEVASQVGKPHIWTSFNGPWGDVTDDSGEMAARGINISCVEGWAIPTE